MNGMVYYGYASHGKTKSTPRSARSDEQTLASSFKPTSVVALLERNYQTFCAQNSLLVEDTITMKDKISRILEKTELNENRAQKCSEGDFLRLLQAFREENIFFC